MFPRAVPGPGPGLRPPRRAGVHGHRQGGPLPLPAGEVLRRAQGGVPRHHRAGPISISTHIYIISTHIYNIYTYLHCPGARGGLHPDRPDQGAQGHPRQ